MAEDECFFAFDANEVRLRMGIQEDGVKGIGVWALQSIEELEAGILIGFQDGFRNGLFGRKAETVSYPTFHGQLADSFYSRL